MENDVKEFLSELLKQLKSIDYIKPEDIPNIEIGRASCRERV